MSALDWKVIRELWVIRGQVLAIAIVIAAGLSTVILPAQNEPDLDDLPDDVRTEMTIHLVDDVADVLELALGDAEVAHMAA